MDPDRLWKEHSPAAFARQIEAAAYQTFVAMPFRDRYSYRSREVFEQVVCRAAEQANARPQAGGLAKSFAPPVRADTAAAPATEITDDIVRHILECHVFLADLTLENPGVLVELGVAMALKPLPQIVLINQGGGEQVHFDLQGHRVIDYSGAQALDAIADALCAAAAAFERSVGQRMDAVRQGLTPDAVYLLNLYGRRRLANPGAALHPGAVLGDTNLGPTAELRRLAFGAAVRELLARGLIRLDYTVADDGVHPDRYGLHATALGLAFVRLTWPNSFGGLT